MRQAEPRELDISPLDAIDRYPALRRWFDRIAVGEGVWVVTDRDPGLFRRRLQHDRPGAFHWSADRRHEHLWIVVVTKVRLSPVATGEDQGYWKRMTDPVLDRPASPAPPAADSTAQPPSLYEQLRRGISP